MLKNKKEQEMAEMRRALEAQIEEKRKRQDEDRKRRQQEDMMFDRTVSVMQPHEGGTMRNTAREFVPTKEGGQDREREATAAPGGQDAGENILAPREEKKGPEPVAISVSSPQPQSQRTDLAKRGIGTNLVSEPMRSVVEEESPQPMKRDSEGDVRVEALKSQLQALSDEKAELMREIEGRDRVISDMKMNQTKYAQPMRPHATKHKVIASADSRKKADRRRKEEQSAQLVLCHDIARR